uniref:Sugar transporter SWEET1 n=1 Tax=Hyaloperonospora arabidopsidis (strain Emoy2) TaxID=559515 RepID=M4B7Q9_HYAAE
MVLVGLVLFPFVAAHEGVAIETVEVIVGSFSVAVSAVMFGSPLILVKKVVQERNTSYLPLTMIVAGAVTCGFWILYGLLLQDAFVIVPNTANLLIGVVQLMLFCIYPRGKTYDTVESVTPEAKATTLDKSDEALTIVVLDKKTKADDVTVRSTEDENSRTEA